MEKDALFIGRLFLYAPVSHGNEFWLVMLKPSFLKKCGIIYTASKTKLRLTLLQKHTPKGRKDEVYESHRKPAATNLTPRPAAPQVKQGHILFQFYERKNSR